LIDIAINQIKSINEVSSKSYALREERLQLIVLFHPTIGQVFPQIINPTRIGARHHKEQKQSQPTVTWNVVAALNDHRLRRLLALKLAS
jgi:hypothetical protein